MAIERADDRDGAGLDDLVTANYTWYDLLHRLAHQVGFPQLKEAIAEAKRRYEAEPEAEFTIDIPVIIPRQMLEPMVKRFEETHDPEELVAPGAQAYFGGAFSQMLQQMGAVPLTPEQAEALGLSDEPAAPVTKDPKSNLH